MASLDDLSEPWRSVPQALRRRGLRWTSQRETVVRALAGDDGHVTGAALVERCLAADPRTIPSTVYRTLDALEDLGIVRHGHGADGREEYHVGPGREHGHRYCSACGRHWDIEAGTRGARRVEAAFADDGFLVDLSHVTVVGRCADCQGS